MQEQSFVGIYRMVGMGRMPAVTYIPLSLIHYFLSVPAVFRCLSHLNLHIACHLNNACKHTYVYMNMLDMVVYACTHKIARDRLHTKQMLQLTEYPSYGLQCEPSIA